MEQLRRAFRNEVHFALRLLVPPRSFLQTLATREKTDLPQFMYSTAPTQRSLYYFGIFIFHSRKKQKNYVPSLKKKYTKSGSSKDPTKLGLLRYVESNCGVLRGSRYMIGSTPWKYKHQQQRSDNCRVNISIRQSSIIPTAGIIKITMKADSTLRQSNPQREKSSADG